MRRSRPLSVEDGPFIGLSQYQQVVADPVFWKAMTNTVLFTFLSILFQFTIGFLLALYFQLEFQVQKCLFITFADSLGDAIVDLGEYFQGAFQRARTGQSVLPGDRDRNRALAGRAKLRPGGGDCSKHLDRFSL